MSNKRRYGNGSLVTGILLLIVGTALLLQNFEVIFIGSVWSHWPLGLVIIGLVKLFNVADAKQIGEGVWWIFIGLWLYVSVRHLYGLGFGDTWPALIIAWGISIVWKSFIHQPYCYGKE